MPTLDFPIHLSRTLFGLSACFHFLFVPLSIGLLLCMNLLQTRHVISRRASLDDAARFWSRCFFLVWATGIITGYALRDQVTGIWTHYLNTATPVLHAIFGIEACIAPFMMGGVVAITWLRKWIPSALIMLIGWGVLALLCVQALTILSVNAWMQVPSTLTQASGSWQLTSVQQVLFSTTSLYKFFHTISAALISGAFFVFGIAGYFLKTGRHTELARDSLQVACWTGLLACVVTLYSGHASTLGVLKHQPMKFAAFEAHWQRDSDAAPLVLLAWPNSDTARNEYELAIPQLMTWFGAGTMEQSPPGILDLSKQIEDRLTSWQHAQPSERQLPSMLDASGGLDTSWQSLNQPMPVDITPWLKLRDAVAHQHGDAWQQLSEKAQIRAVVRHAQPPVMPLFILYRVMVLCGIICLGLCVWAFVKQQALLSGQQNTLLNALIWAAPLPWVAILSGWCVAEIGRQPWTIYEHLTTHHAAQTISLDAGLTTSLMALLSGMGLTWLFVHLLRWIIRTGPAPLLSRQRGNLAKA